MSPRLASAMRVHDAPPDDGEDYRIAGNDLAAKRNSEALDIVHAHCSIYTRPRVAEAMLDAVGWKADRNLEGMRLLEPCCGDGAFLRPAVDRLLASVGRRGALGSRTLANAIVGFEFDPCTALGLRVEIASRLAAAGLAVAAANEIAARWVRCEDFLLAEVLGTFTHIVGNPPYMRWSKVPKSLRRAYEERLAPEAARGDLCLPFIWRAAELSQPPTGQVALLCADRWLRCAYGDRARRNLRTRLRISTHIEAHKAPVFEGRRKVGAYAAVTLLDHDHTGGAAIATVDTVKALVTLLTKSRGTGSRTKTPRLLPTAGGALIAGPDLANVLGMIAEHVPRLGEAGVTVRCGMALGVAPAFVVEADAAIERDRLIPFVRSQDLLSNGMTTSKKQVIDVWTPQGPLVDLSNYPRLAEHLAPFRKALEARACVSDPGSWYKTIDRPHANRDAERVFVAGMARHARLAIATRGEQASNAVYVLSSETWPVRALFALLQCGALDLFASALAPTFSGGSKRFDGNLLRQVRIPPWFSVSPELKTSLLSLDPASTAATPALLGAIYGLKSRRDLRAVADALSHLRVGPA